MNGNELIRLLLRIAGYLCVSFGALFMLIAGGLYFHTRSFLLHSTTADAVVVRLAETRDDENAINYAPVFTFTAQNGHSYTIQSDTSSSPSDFSVGQHAQVMYDPSQPNGARINSFMQLWLFHIVLGSFGILAVFVGAGLLMIKRVIDRKTANSLGADSQIAP